MQTATLNDADSIFKSATAGYSDRRIIYGLRYVNRVMLWKFIRLMYEYIPEQSEKC